MVVLGGGAASYERGTPLLTSNSVTSGHGGSRRLWTCLLNAAVEQIMAYVRQSRADSGLDFRVKILETSGFKKNP